VHKEAPIGGTDGRDHAIGAGTAQAANVTQHAATDSRPVETTVRHGHLHVFDLESAPPFVALSYVWGSEDHKQPFMLNGSEYQVTTNLAAALHHLEQYSEAPYFWIDSLCINQSDLVEKSSQVAHMRDIYQTAHSVTVWLGCASDATDQAIAIITFTGHQAAGLGVSMPSYGIGNGVQELLDQHPQLVESMDNLNGPMMELVWDGVQDLMKKEWWSRVWILQEFAVAREATFQCGTQRVRADIFECGVFFFERLSIAWLQSAAQRGKATPSVTSRLAKAFVGTTATEVFRSRHGYRYFLGSEGRRLDELMDSLYWCGKSGDEFQASNPRDKVYALIGLAQDAPSLRIIPDYTKSVEEVFIDTTEKMIKCYGLGILRYCNYDAGSGLPSWVPALFETTNRPIRQTLPADEEFSAGQSADTVNPPRTLSDDRKVLVVQACRIGTVSEVGSTFVEAGQRRPVANYLAAVTSYLKKAAAMKQCPYASGDTTDDDGQPEWLQQAEYCIPVGDIESFGQGGAVRATELTKECHNNLVEFLKNVEVEDDELPGFLSGQDRTHGHARMLHWAHLGCTLERHPFITENGYVGTGPDDIREDDEVVILVGEALPYILRPAEQAGRWILLGTAYVHGVMDGEFMEKHPPVSEMHLQ
jgi:hypothetical protein